MNYTKGNWQARKLLPDKHGIITKEAWEIFTLEYDVVASIEHSAPIRKESDAHLIAAAPDMYEALKEFLDSVSLQSPHGAYQDKEGQDVCGACGTYFITGNRNADKAILKLEKALVQAEGK